MTYLFHTPFTVYVLSILLLCASALRQRSTLRMDIYGSFSKPVQINLGMLGWAAGKSYVNGELSVSFSPWLPQGSSQLVTCYLPLPLGIDIEQSDEDGMCRVVDISGEGSVDLEGGSLKVGDIFRAVTAREKHMVYPQAQVALGGIGRPQLVTSFLPIERRPDALDTLLGGIRSNLELSSNSDDKRLQSPGYVQIIAERPK